MITQASIVVAIIAIVEAIKSKVPQVQGLVTVVLAIVLGGVAGYLNLGGLDIVSGAILGAGAVGVNTTADSIGGK